MDGRLVGTWRIEAIATRTGEYDDPNPTWITRPPDPEQGDRLHALAHTFRADGTGQIVNSDATSPAPEQFTWRDEEDDGKLYLILDTPQGPVSMRVWLQSDGRLVWEQNVFSRCIDGRCLWFDPTSRQWVGREWLSQFSGWVAFVLARDATPATERGGIVTEHA